MRSIESYIQDLLFVHECVIIPGFGGFVANYTDACIDAKSSTFLPPSKELAFNIQLNSNDGLLTGYISQQEGIGYSEAKADVDKYTEYLEKELQRKGFYEIPGIGNFSISKEGNIGFSPIKSANFLTNSFGLEAFHFPVLKEEEIIRKVERKILSVKKSERKQSSLIIRAVAGIAAACLLTFLPYSITKQSKQVEFSGFSQGNLGSIAGNPHALMNNPSSIDDAVGLMTNKKVALFYSENSSQNKDDAKKNTAEAKMPVKKSEQLSETKDSKQDNIIDKPKNSVTKANEPKFYLIAGSFASLKQAKSWSKKLTDKGYNIEFLPEENGKNRISIGQYSTREEADKNLVEARKADVSVWVLTKNN